MHEYSELKKQFLQWNQLFVLPINILNAFILSFLWIDFTRVSTTWQINLLG